MNTLLCFHAFFIDIPLSGAARQPSSMTSSGVVTRAGMYNDVNITLKHSLYHITSLSTRLHRMNVTESHVGLDGLFFFCYSILVFSKFLLYSYHTT